MYRMEKYIFPIIGNEHIARMEALDILKVIQPIEQKGQNETARRLLQIIGQIYRFAVITGRAKRNPVTDLSGAIRPRKVTHRAAITEPKKVAQLLRNIDAYEGYFPIMCALKLAPLVFVRPTELRATEWTGFDFATSEWRIPATRVKMKQIHIVPLSRQAVAILKELQEFSGNGKLLFPSIRSEKRPLADATVLMRFAAWAAPRMKCASTVSVPWLPLCSTNSATTGTGLSASLPTVKGTTCVLRSRTCT